MDRGWSEQGRKICPYLVCAGGQHNQAEHQCDHGRCDCRSYTKCHADSIATPETSPYSLLRSACGFLGWRRLAASRYTVWDGVLFGLRYRLVIRGLPGYRRSLARWGLDIPFFFFCHDEGRSRRVSANKSCAMRHGVVYGCNHRDRSSTALRLGCVYCKSTKE